jgi:hypothetical protein
MSTLSGVGKQEYNIIGPEINQRLQTGKAGVKHGIMDNLRKDLN